jgi:hypothetical protein
MNRGVDIVTAVEMAISRCDSVGGGVTFCGSNPERL